MISKHHNHVIWDWNGTLVDDTAFCTELLNDSLSKYNLPQISIEKYRNEFHFPVESYYKQLGFSEVGVSFEEISLLFIESYRDGWKHCQLHKKAIELFHLLEKQGRKQSILSASKQKPLEEYVEHFNIQDFFSDLVGVNHHYASSKLEEGKEWLRSKKLNPDSMIMIGDTEHDYEVANSLGIDCILVAHGHYHHSRLKKTGAKVIDSFEELWESLQS